MHLMLLQKTPRQPDTRKCQAAGTPRFSLSETSARVPKQPPVAEKSSVVVGSGLYLRDVLEVEELCVLIILLSTQVLRTDRV